MSHFAKYSQHEEIMWEDTYIERYDNNNGIVLKRRSIPSDEVIAYIDGANVGVSWDDLSDVPVKRAEPIFKTVLDGYNRAFKAGYNQGDHDARAEIRKSLRV